MFNPTLLCHSFTSVSAGEQAFTLSEKKLLLWAQRVGAYIIEDDYDAVFSWEEKPLSALKSMDSCDRVIYAGTFSKTLGPGIRLGYLVCPDSILESVQSMKALNNSGSNWLFQQFLAEFMHNQVFYTHLSKLSCVYEERQRLLHEGLLRLFPEGKIWGHAAGLHLTLITPLSVEFIQTLRQRCLRAGVRFDTLNEMANGSECLWQQMNNQSVILFGFGSLNLQQLQKYLPLLSRK